MNKYEARVKESTWPYFSLRLFCEEQIYIHNNRSILNDSTVSNKIKAFHNYKLLVRGNNGEEYIALFFISCLFHIGSTQWISTIYSH